MSKFRPIDLGPELTITVGRTVELSELTEHVRRWKLLHPNESPPTALVVRARGATSTSMLTDPLRAAVGLGFKAVLICAAPHIIQTQTETLGTIERREGCALSLELGNGGPRLEQYGTWADVARAAQSGMRSLTP